MKWYKQYDSMDCGPTCLKMVVKHYKRNVSLQFLRDKSQIGREGVSLLGISEAAEAIGFRTQALKISYCVLTRDVRLPAILHWKQNHFVVLYKVSKDKLYIADPAKGLITYTPDEFRKNWISDRQNQSDQGVVLVLEPSPDFFKMDFDEDATAKELRFSSIIRYILPYKRLVVQLCLGLLVAAILQLFPPFLTQSIVDSGINSGNIQFVYVILFAQLALLAGRLAIEFVRSWILLHISMRINLNILTDFLIKLMKLPLPFFESKHTGDILQRMSDHKRIETFLTGSSLNVLFSLVSLFIFSFVLCFFNKIIFFVFILSSIVYSIWVAVFLAKRKELDYKRFDVSARQQSMIIQLIQGMQEIRMNGVEKPYRWSWERLQVRLFKLSMKNLSLTQVQQVGAFFINEGKNVVITFLSAKAVIDGQMTLGSMFAIQYIVGSLNSPIEQMISFLQSWQNARISMNRLNEVHTLEDEEPADKNFFSYLPVGFARQLTGGGDATANYSNPDDIVENESALLPANEIPQDMFTIDSGLQSVIHNESADGRRHNGDVAGDAVFFRNVSFTYPGAGNEPVLKNVSISFPKGKTTAIVGASGSGKTTILKLMLRFYEPQVGEIRVGGLPFASISPKYWRRHCGVVMQESFVFSDTLARNIAVGTEQIDMRRLYQALEIANIRDFVSQLPLGLNTRIGSEGTGISMGQRQRILIARAVYRDPDFIFFDEATNSLDANNESVIVQNLNSFFNRRTVVVVAHRLSTVKNADQIIVIDKGEIKEIGTHAELIDLKGEYFTLVRNQLELGN